MSSLIIRKYSNKVWEHIASDQPLPFYLSKFYVSVDGDFLRIVEQGEAKRNKYNFQGITIEVVGGQTFNNFSSVDLLLKKLEELGYPAFYKDGEAPPPEPFAPKLSEVTLYELGIITPTYTRAELETAVTNFRTDQTDINVLENFNFWIEADWVAQGVNNQATFEAFMTARGLSDIVVTNFEYSPTMIRCDLRANVGGVSSNLSRGYTKILGFGVLIKSFSVTNLIFNQNLLTLFNPLTSLPRRTNAINLSNNQLTTASYTEMEVWANLQEPFIISCTITLTGNIDSPIGTNFEAIMLTKNATILW